MMPSEKEAAQVAKLICICGKICSGKTTLARRLLEKGGAVLLSCDEAADVIFDKNLGDRHDEVMAKVTEFLHRKAADILTAGCDVILDWGFWKKAARKNVRERYAALGFEQLWYFVDVADEKWENHIQKRNADVLAGLSADYFVDEGLKAKLLANFEKPEPDEYDIKVGP